MSSLPGIVIRQKYFRISPFNIEYERMYMHTSMFFPAHYM